MHVLSWLPFDVRAQKADTSMRKPEEEDEEEAITRHTVRLAAGRHNPI